MNKKIFFLCICLLSVCMCACSGTVSEKESASLEIEQDVFQEDKQIESDVTNEISKADDNKVSEDEVAFLGEYNDLVLEEGAKKSALIFLDEDDIPELLYLKNGEYNLYSYDGSEIRKIDMPTEEIKVNAYGSKHDFEDSDQLTFYWFEYVPYKGLIRVHGGDKKERHDYYLKYKNGSFVVDLETKSMNYTWYTYDAEQEIANEDFLKRMSDLGYDKLIPCAFLYESVAEAYENIGQTSNTREILEDFVSGDIDAVHYVETVKDIPEESFAMRNYEDFYEDIINGEEEGWGRIEYVDFDNDGEEELILRGYTGACFFFDVIGNTVYEVIKTFTTTDVAFVAEIEGKKVIARTDLTHVGREYYRVMQYDACGCLVDWFRLSASYEGSSYSSEDTFKCREREITMEEFEAMANSILE